MKSRYIVAAILGCAITIVTLRSFFCSMLVEDSSNRRIVGSYAALQSQAAESREETRGGRNEQWIGMPVETGSSNIPVFAINTLPGSAGLPRTSGIIVVLWQDGRLIWSQNDLCGGPVYYEGKIATTAVAEFLDNLATLQGVFQGTEFWYFQAHYEPPWTIMSFNHGRHTFQVITAHEHIEHGKDRVSTRRGIRYLKKGESKEAVLAEQPLGYRQCRSAWETIRDSARALTGDGKPVDVSFEIRRVRVVDSSR